MWLAKDGGEPVDPGQETDLNHTFVFVDSWVLEGDAEFYAWIWGDNGEGGHWVKLETEVEGDYPTAHIEEPNTMKKVKVVRVNPAATAKPVDGATTYGDGVDDQLWNWTDDFDLSQEGGSYQVVFNHSHH